MFHDSPVTACQHVRNLPLDWRCQTSRDALQGFRNDIYFRVVVAGKRVFVTGDGPRDVIGDMCKEGRRVAFFEWCECFFNEFGSDHRKRVQRGT